MQRSRKTHSIKAPQSRIDAAGKVAVITGGASGIGFAVGRALAARGAHVMLIDIERPALQNALDHLRHEGLTVSGRVTDVGSRAEMEDLAEAVFAVHGCAHFVMHNAGVVVSGPVQSLTDEDWEWALSVNLLGALNGVQAFLPRMLATSEPGHMVFTASFAELVPNRAFAPYNVTKAAVVALAESLHKDLRGSAIGVSVLCPMRVESRIEDSARNRPKELGGQKASRVYTEDERATLQGRTLSADAVATLVIDAINRGDLYIHTHSEAQEFIRKRAQRILDAFVYSL